MGSEMLSIWPITSEGIGREGSRTDFRATYAAPLRKTKRNRVREQEKSYAGPFIMESSGVPSPNFGVKIW